MNATAKIVAKLNEVFAPMDAEVLEASQEWAKGRVQAIREFKASEEGQAMRRNFESDYYGNLHAIAGGEAWYNVFDGRDAAMIEKFVTKNCKTIADKRNACIAAKLKKAGVTEVVLSEGFTKTRDGFNGVLIVNTDAGKKRATINTIRAGGYNVQCLHLRILVKVK